MKVGTTDRYFVATLGDLGNMFARQEDFQSRDRTGTK